MDRLVRPKEETFPSKNRVSNNCTGIICFCFRSKLSQPASFQLLKSPSFQEFESSRPQDHKTTRSQDQKNQGLGTLFPSCGSLFQRAYPTARSFGGVSALLKESGKEVAHKSLDPRIEYKIEPIYKCDTLRQARNVYKVLWNTEIPIGFPRLITYHETSELAFIAMPMLGQSLRDAWMQKGRFSIRSIGFIATQMLNRLEFIHRHGVVHLDIKPDNMILGRWMHSKTVYLIDFGIASSFRDSSGWHKTYCEGFKFSGTSIFSSVYRDEIKQYSRRDDLESLMYSLIMLYNNCLPWCWGDWACRSNYSKSVENEKSTYRDSLCGGTPAPIQEAWRMVRTMKYAAKPRYERLRELFLEAAESCTYHDGLNLNLE